MTRSWFPPRRDVASPGRVRFCRSITVPSGRSVSFPIPIPFGLLSVFRPPSHRQVLLPDRSFCCARAWFRLAALPHPRAFPHSFEWFPALELKATSLPPPFPFRAAPPFGFATPRSGFSLRFLRPCRRLLRRLSTTLSCTSTGLLGVFRRSHLSHCDSPATHFCSNLGFSGSPFGFLGFPVPARLCVSFAPLLLVDEWLFLAVSTRISALLPEGSCV